MHRYVADADPSRVGRTVPGMKETDERWAGTRRRLMAGVVALAVVTQVLEAVNAVVTFVTNLG
jgi:hypothetical protein